MKDLKQLLEVDKTNTVAKTVFEEVKKMWEKQLREKQAESQPRKAFSEKDISKLDKKGKADALATVKKLEKLIATTKKLKEREDRMKMESSKKPDVSGAGKSSPKLSRSGQKQGVSAGGVANSTSTSTNSASSPVTKKNRRRKVVVEEVNGKSGSGLHRLSSQPAPRENRPVSRRQEKVAVKKEKSIMEEEHVRVAEDRMSHKHMDTCDETERVEKALAEKAKELETKRAMEKLRQQAEMLHKEEAKKTENTNAEEKDQAGKKDNEMKGNLQENSTLKMESSIPDTVRVGDTVVNSNHSNKTSLIVSQSVESCITDYSTWQ